MQLKPLSFQDKIILNPPLIADYELVMFSKRPLRGNCVKTRLGRILTCMILAFCINYFPTNLRAETLGQKLALAAHISNNPADLDSTYKFVALSIESGDYEAAIGALERLLMFNPRLSRAEMELGFLYARLGAYQAASEHLNLAQSIGDLDTAQQTQIRAQIADIDKRNEKNRVTGRILAGLRSQTNANFFPSNGLFQIGGVGYGSTLRRQGDVNSYEMIQIAHDYDFENQSGDQLETRGAFYATQQFSIPTLNVSVFSASIGPRFGIPEAPLRGVSVKPYVAGIASTLGNQNYLNSGGAGLVARIPITPSFVIDPGFEWRSLFVNRNNSTNGGYVYSTISTIASGDAVTGFVSGIYQFSDRIKFEGRASFTRANAFLAVQTSDQIDFQGMARIEFNPPNKEFGQRWTVAPFVRYTNLRFMEANPLVDPWIARQDDMWAGGILLDAPINEDIGFVGNIEYANNISNISNYKLNNFLVSLGPVVKF